LLQLVGATRKTLEVFVRIGRIDHAAADVILFKDQIARDTVGGCQFGELLGILLKLSGAVVLLPTILTIDLNQFDQGQVP